MLPIVEAKITTSESEIDATQKLIAQLQSRIAAEQQRISQLNRVENIAAAVLSAAQSGIQEITGIEPDAIAELQAELLKLFGNDGNENQPSPAPTPQDGGGTEVDTEQEEIAAKDPQGNPALESTVELATNFQSELEARGIQKIDLLSTTSGWRGDVARENQEFSKDSASESAPTHGTQVIHRTDGSVKFHLNWNRLSDRVATYSSPENPYSWEHGFVTYLGFPKKEVAEAWQQHLLKIGVATKCIIRKVNRLKVDTPKGVRIRWEMKIHGLSERQLQHILEFDLTQLPSVEQKASAGDFKVCDRVRILQTSGGSHDNRIGTYGIVERVDESTNSIEVRADSNKFGTLLLKPEWAVKLDATQFPACCNLPEPEVMAALGKFHAGDRIKVVEPGHPDNGEFGTVKRLVVVDGVVAAQLDESPTERLYPPSFIELLKIEDLEPAVADEVVTTTDWKARAKELKVSLNNVTIGMYVAYYSHRKLGQVVEKFDADNDSWWENRNQLTAVSYGNGDGQKYADPYEAAIALAKLLKLVKDAEESSADLLGGFGESEPQPIKTGDWVELTVNGDRYQVDSIDAEGFHLATDDGNMLVQPNEVKLIFQLPADWKPF
jgi:hypothetical protein